MKRGTIRHPKTDALMDNLSISRAQALGILTMLWDWTGEYAPRGDIGKYSNATIARAVEWPVDQADLLIAGLTQSGWLDDNETSRVVVHDWSHHCERWVTLRVQRLDGIAYDSDAVRTPCAQKTDSVRTAPALVPRPSSIAPAAAVGSDASVLLLLKIGVSRKKAETMGEIPSLTILAIWLECQHATKPIGLMIKRLSDGDPPPIPTAARICQAVKMGLISRISINGQSWHLNGNLGQNDSGLFIDKKLIITADHLNECEVWP